MRKIVTLEDIQKINELYYQCKNKSEVARQTGWDRRTIDRYLNKNYSPDIKDKIHYFNPVTDLPEFTTKGFENVDNLGSLCVLSDEEKEEIKELWEELII